MAPIIIALGGTLLRVAAKQLPKYLKQGAKKIDKPTMSQKEKSSSCRAYEA